MDQYQANAKKDKDEIGNYYTACYVREGNLNQQVGEGSTKDMQPINVVHPLIQQQSHDRLQHPFMDYSINMLLNRVHDERADPSQPEYQMARVAYNNENNSYTLKLQDWPAETSKGVMKETKPHTLRSGVSRSVTVNERLYILHYLCTKDSTVPA